MPRKELKIRGVVQSFVVEDGRVHFVNLASWSNAIFTTEEVRRIRNFLTQYLRSKKVR